MNNNELYHYGILGMRWGNRRGPSNVSKVSSGNKKEQSNDKIVSSGKKKVLVALGIIGGLTVSGVAVYKNRGKIAVSYMSGVAKRIEKDAFRSEVTEKRKLVKSVNNEIRKAIKQMR